MGTYWIVLFTWVLLVGIIALGVRRRLKGGLLVFFRALLPSWRFFDRVGAVPELCFRIQPLEGAPSAWFPLLPRARRRARNILLNPSGNLIFACHSVVERLVEDINDLGETEVAEGVSYQLCTRMAREFAKPYLKTGDRLQFKVRIRQSGVADHDLLVSPEIEA